VSSEEARSLLRARSSMLTEVCAQISATARWRASTSPTQSANPYRRPLARSLLPVTWNIMNASTSLGYRPWLDGLRGIAISTVFIHHLQHFLYQGGPMFGWLFVPFESLGVDDFSC
jgi:hypothetical protein